KKARQEFTQNASEKLDHCMLLTVIDQVISEKRMQYGDHIDLRFDFEKDAYSAFSLIKPIELSRVLSNLINNSIEAVSNNNSIDVFLSLKEGCNEALIQIQDYGKGIESGNLSRIGELGGTFGKKYGTGVGLNHAISVIK